VSMTRQLDRASPSTGEVLVTFNEPVSAKDTGEYRARACGSIAGDGTRRWQGWIEFVPVEGGPTIRTERETTQRNRADTAMWASRLTRVYLDGALRRALYSSTITAEESTVERPAPATGPAAMGFARVGGMSDLKAQIRRIVETVHIRKEDARRYGVIRNGILLYGPPGCGKTLFAQAIAEEFGLNLLNVPLESAVTKYVGGAPEAIQRIFEEARTKTPCLLFFDEFDAIVHKRQDAVMLQEQQTVDALLQQLDAHREVLGLLIVAATNRFDDLDPAVIREGRFDYKIRIGNPDLRARLAILRTLIKGRPHGRRLGLAELAKDLDGFSSAQIRSVVDEAALAALEAGQPIREEHLRAAYRTHVAASRHAGVKLGWDDLILPDDTKRKLQLVERVIENPQIVRELGITPPSGILFYGPPGTGKTTAAQVLASETEASFFAINASDVFSKWLGESEQRVKELFDRARARVPAIIFIDEIDAILDRRMESDAGGDRVRNSVVSMFLAQMDGLDSSSRIFVIGATNRPELLDEALLRPGRLGEKIEIPLPDLAGRRAMLELFSRKMRCATLLDLEQLAVRTDGTSGATLNQLCTLAGRNALVRQLEDPSAGDAPAVTQEDFDKAFLDLSPDIRRRPIGF